MEFQDLEVVVAEVPVLKDTSVSSSLFFSSTSLSSPSLKSSRRLRISRWARDFFGGVFFDFCLSCWVAFLAGVGSSLSSSSDLRFLGFSLAFVLLFRLFSGAF